MTPRCLRLPIVLSFFAGVVIVIWHALVQIPSQNRDCTKMAHNTPLEGQSPAGIGFDLTTFYGTVAITYSDGSAIDVARVEAKPQYREVIERLSLDSSIHLCPPYNAFDEIYRDLPRRTLRALRKAVGLPASGDVAALSTMVQELRCEAETILGAPISSIPIVAVAPSLIALYEEDLVDAFEYAGLQLSKLKNYSPGHYVHETSAAYAGYGLGLCSEYKNPGACQEEERQMPRVQILSILYTRGGLRIIYAPVRSAYYFYEMPLRFYAHWDLGFDARNEKDYWKQVRDAIQQGTSDYPGFPVPEKVLLLGDSASDETFRIVLKDIISGWAKTPEVLGEDSEFVAAKGAAEFAKRSIYKNDNASTIREGEGEEEEDKELK